MLTGWKLPVSNIIYANHRMLTALMHITSSQPHACSSHTELVLYLQRSLCFIQKKKKTRSRAFSLCSWDNQDSCEDEDVRASHLKPDKTPAGVCRFFFSSGRWTWSLWLPAVCVSSASVADTQRGSDQCVKCKNIHHDSFYLVFNL